MKFRKPALAMAFALLLLNGRASLPLFAQYQSISEHTLSQTEAKELGKSASTPEDHLKLAEFFRDQAQQEEAAAKFNQQMAMGAPYTPSPYQGHRYSLKEMKEHFGYLAKKTSKAAAKFNKRAAEEESIAKEMREHPYRGGSYHR